MCAVIGSSDVEGRSNVLYGVAASVQLHGHDMIALQSSFDDLCPGMCHIL
jgi:hypothetical protein